MPKLSRKLKYEGDLDREFAEEIASEYCGKQLFDCIQCGTCSGSCPMSEYMDYSPREIIGMTREGFKKEVLMSNTAWICSSCYACTVNCPQEIKITDIMYALKRYAVKHNCVPEGLPAPIMADEFMKIVRKYGRNSEMRLIMNMGFKQGILSLVKMAPLGANLFFHGRLAFLADKMKNIDQLNTILDAVNEEDE